MGDYAIKTTGGGSLRDNNNIIVVPLEKEESLCRRAFFSIYSYVAIFCLFGIFSVSYHSCFNGSLSTLEKRYQFSSSTGGLIMITDNVAVVLTNLFIGYYGKTAHRPRWMAIGCIVTGISVMLTALPYFIYGPPQMDDLERAKNITLSKSRVNDEMCHLTPEHEECSGQSFNSATTMTMVAVIIFGASNFFRGFGTSLYFTYGTPYLDDNVSRSKMPAFFGFIFSMRIFGAPLGFYLTSISMKYYENPFMKPEGITEKDPRWIGAWWIGFLISGMALLLLAFPLSLFPREFKKKPSNRNRAEGEGEEGEDESEELTHLKQIDTVTGTVPAASNEDSFVKQQKEKTNQRQYDSHREESRCSLEKKEEEKEKEKKKVQNLSLKELPGEMYQIATNPIVACSLAGSLFRGIGIIGHFVFQTKYYEAQFRQSASKASLISGTTGILSKIIGVQLGGLLITLLKPGPRVLTTCIFLVEATSVVTLLFASTIQGPNPRMPGVMKNEITGMLELTNECNRECHCGVKNYQPVCNIEQGTAYFSPCHAGCTKSFMNMAKNSTEFSECTCLYDTDGHKTPSVRTTEKCPPDTNNLITYATIIAVGGMISGSGRPGNIVTFLRSVTQEQKALAVAMTSFWHSLFVSIPYPLIYGKIFDDSCIVWSKTCDKRGNCWLYDTNKLRQTYHTVSIVLIAIGSLFDFIMIFLSPRLKNLYGETASTKKKRSQSIKSTPGMKILEPRSNPEEVEVFSKGSIATTTKTNPNNQRQRSHIESSF